MGQTLGVFPLAALLALTPGPAGSSSPSPAPADARTQLAPATRPAARTTSESPLREIGRVHATTDFCRATVGTALGGISVLLDDDVRLDDAKTTMHHLSANPDPVTKNNGLKRLLDDYVALRDATRNGRRSIKRLKHDTERAPSEDQKQALLSLANAVDGALTRQQVMADDLARFAFDLESRERIMDPKYAKSLSDPGPALAGLALPHTVTGSDVPTPDRAYVGSTHAVDEFEQSATLLTRDEDAAATRIDPAFDKC